MKQSIANRIRYWFDNLMSKGVGPAIFILTIFTLMMIIAISFFGYFLNLNPQKNIWEYIWMGLMATFQSNSVVFEAGKGNEFSYQFIVAMLIVTFLGVFVMSTLIGFITSAIQGKIQSLRKGRSIVLESNHIVILGWNDQIITIVKEIVAANGTLYSQHGKSCVVIMGEKDKVEMEDELREKIGNFGRTRIVCRQGSPFGIDDLAITNLTRSHSIIILSNNAENPDAMVIKSLLAIVKNRKHRKAPFHVICEMHGKRNIEIARIVGGNEVEIIPANDITSKVIAQTSRQIGLAIVYEELFKLTGDYIYIEHEHGLEGTTFAETLFEFENSTVIGIKKAGKKAVLNPPMDTIIAKDDKLILIKGRDKQIPARVKAFDPEAIVSVAGPKDDPLVTLILGWNRKIFSIIRAIDDYVPPGSSVIVAANHDGGSEELARHFDGKLKNTAVKFMPGRVSDRNCLEELVESNHESIILLSDDNLARQETDSVTLMTLLHLRDIARKRGKEFLIVSEMLDTMNRRLADITKDCDFIVSEAFMSLLIAQISINKHLAPVFYELFDRDTSDIFIKPASGYVLQGRKVGFGTVIEAARKKNEIAIGYRLQAYADNPKIGKEGYGFFINPGKSDQITFSEGDKVIVIGEN
jgi:ion channel POLLUX/CASTOR